jgi:general secretion pathway protein F
MRYELKTVTPEGRVEQLDIDALDEASARSQAAGMGYAILALRVKPDFAAFLQQRERFSVLLFSQELLVLLNAGLPLVGAIETLTEKERNARARSVLQSVSAMLRQGRTLSAALEQHPASFSALYVATIRASERTSDLAPALARYITYQNQVEAIRKRMLNASIYPALLIFTGALVSLFLMLFVVPRFGKIYGERGAELPWVSKLLLQWGQAVEGHTAMVIGILLALCALLWYVSQLPQVRSRVGAMLWRLPGIGERMQVYQLARFYRTIGMLLRGGMPLVSSLQMGAQLLHPVLRQRLSGASREISEGQPVSAAMERNGLTTPVALRMLTVGEQGGNMGEMMDNIALFHDEEISRWVDWFTRLFEPILMAFIGIVIGGIVILMYMPIFELAGSLK